MFNELGIDSGWQEGGGYWNYGVHTSSFFADALKRLTKESLIYLKMNDLVKIQ